ncbi:MAG: DUF4390 domain-containing protein [Deltaproteobacteria bacterium]|nr:DUF4390 domain-containing protein [Deltaproteobacteria bacterium]MBW2662237.1 DUF4390 domain-containing protein [Deltaproteobacteria bacterium]
MLFCMMFLLQHPAFASDVKLANIIVTNTRDDLLVYLTVEGAFSEKIKKAVLNGVPADFSFYINLYQIRNWWIDKQIACLKITNTIKYNNLKKEFHVKRSWESDKTIVAKTFEEAQKLMSEIDSMKIIPLSSLEKDERYQIRTKAEIGKLTLPFYLHHVLFFISLWDVDTDWYTIDFIY